MNLQYKKEQFAEISGFFLSLVLAVCLGWSLPDLVWSMWLSSLVIGFTYIVYSIYKNTSPVKHKITRILVVIFPVLFFMFHFGMFHFVHSIFLNAFISPDGIISDSSNWEVTKTGNGFSFTPKNGKDKDFINSFPNYLLLFKTYFWILPIAFLSNFSLFRNPKQGPAAAYKNVIKLHILIFIFAGMAAMRLNIFVVYLFTYAWFFFPFSVFFSKKSDKKKEEASSLPETSKNP